MDKTIFDLLPFANIYKRTRVELFCFRLSIASVHCTWSCWQTQFDSRARSEQFHMNPPVRFLFFRLPLRGFFQTFPHCLPLTTVQRTLPWLILWTLKLSIIDKKKIKLTASPQNPDYNSDPFDQLHKFSFQEMRNQQVSNLYGSKSSIWSCVPSSPSAKKGTAPHAVCGTITCFQTHQLPVKTGQQEPRTEASLSCFCTIQRHCRDTELTRNTNLNHNREEFRMQAQLPVNHHPPRNLFRKLANSLFATLDRVKWLRSNNHWHTPPLEQYSTQRAP